MHVCTFSQTEKQIKLETSFAVLIINLKEEILKKKHDESGDGKKVESPPYKALFENFHPSFKKRRGGGGRGLLL